ncbi:MAG TPA: FHA domain-containing protein [Kofleriaceae bacterium]|nr:FHA domain-containing protein [Kofleriaceae bacterium]
MLRCSACGHQSPPGSSFCLNCGTALSAATASTQVPGGGLPGVTICTACRGENPPGMKFCRNCGATLGTTPGSPSFAPGGAPMMAPPPGGPIAAPVPFPPPNPAFAPPTGPNASPPLVVPLATSAGGRPSQGGAATITCPRCGTATPTSFAYCQQCGLHMQPIAPTDPGAGSGNSPSRIRPPTNQPPMSGPPLVGGALGIMNKAPMPQPGVDPQAATLATPGGGGAAAMVGAIAVGRAHTPSAPPPVAIGTNAPPTRPSSATAGGAWGAAVLVNRDGTDGQRFALTSEDTIVGRAGADIAFDDDRFLAKQHARIAKGPDGTIKIHPIDTTNGVFKKADASVELSDGMIVLVGREVLRFERVTPEERTIHPLVRHGVALFGSPPRDPWGRLLQLIPSGGYRDVRHLVGEEVVLGREEGDIVFRDDAFMSRRHAAITWDGKRAMLTDLGSSNGTFFRLSGPMTIKNGDHVRMGDQLLRIER